MSKPRLPYSVDYIVEQVRELKEGADNQRLSTLAYLLSLAEAEAERILNASGSNDDKAS